MKTFNDSQSKLARIISLCVIIIVVSTFTVATSHAQPRPSVQPATAGGGVDLGPNSGGGGTDPGTTVGGGGVDNGSNNQKTFTLTNPLRVNSIGELVQNFVDIFSYVVILFAVLVLIFTGFQYVLAQGNPGKIKDLHMRLLYIVIGIAVVIGARVIVDVVINTLGASGAVNPQTIQQAKSANGH